MAKAPLMGSPLAGAGMPQHQTQVPPRIELPSESAVRTELARVLASDVFSRSDRLSAFLSFIVEQTIAGQGHTLKEQVLASELYGKGTDFAAAIDPVVRVDARRLRDKLREYYAFATRDPVVISVPKGSYTPIFQANGPVAAPAIEEVLTPSSFGTQRVTLAPQRRWSRLWVGIATLVVFGVAWLVFGIVRNVRSEPPTLRLFTATAFPGWEGQPSISPDGNFVAFARSGPGAPWINDLWVKSVVGDALRRLTDTPRSHEVSPAWSPDGQQVAFFRLEGPDATINRGVFVVSVLGGQEREVGSGGSPTWVPDGKSLVVGDRTPDGSLALFQHVLETGARRQLTSPPDGFVDAFPAVSPDGETLAFLRSSRRGSRAAFFLVPLSGGEPVRRTEWAEPVAGLAWTPNSREILYSTADMSGTRMFRISAFGNEPGRLVRDLPISGGAPSTSRARSTGTFRVAFVYGLADVGLRLIDLQAARTGDQMDAVTRFCDATRMDNPGRFSRDGTQVAFTSNRGGNPQVWVAARDGSALRSVTTVDAASVNVGSWSADGRAVAFDAVMTGNADIYVVGTNGGPLRRLTDSPASDTDPEWSGDGRWIYYVSDASGRSEIWRIPAAGGRPTKITSHGGFEPREASDGRTLYYVDRPRRTEGLGATVSLKQIPASGGEELVVFSGVRAGTWDITDVGIVFLTTDSGPTVPGREGGDALAVYSFADRGVHRLGALPFALARFKSPRLAVSRDGRWALANHVDSWERDVMVADNFR